MSDTPADGRRRYRLKNLQLTRVDRVERGANQGAHIVLFKSLEDLASEPQDVDTNDPLSKEDESMSDDAQKQDEVTTDPITPEAETVAKADFEAVQKEKAELEAKVAKMAELEQTVAKMQREQTRREFVAKAEQFSNLGDTEELGGLLMAAHEHFEADQVATLERLLAGANEQVEKGALFATFTRTDSDGPLGWENKLEELAKAKVADGTAKTLEIAKQDVMRENAELRAEYIKASGR